MKPKEKDFTASKARQERDRLRKKFGIKSHTGGTWGDGFFSGILLAEKWYEKRKNRKSKGD